MKLKTDFVSVGKLETGQAVTSTAPGWEADQSGAPSASGRRGSWWEFVTEHYAFLHVNVKNTSWKPQTLQVLLFLTESGDSCTQGVCKIDGVSRTLYRLRDTNDFLSIFLCFWFYQLNFPPKVFKSCFVDKNLNEPPKGKVLKETTGSISISNIVDGFVWNDWCEATEYKTLSINFPGGLWNIYVPIIYSSGGDI